MVKANTEKQVGNERGIREGVRHGGSKCNVDSLEAVLSLMPPGGGN